MKWLCDSRTLSTWGWDARGAPASDPNPVTMLRTPGGISTCLQISTNSKQVLQIKLGGTRKKYFLVFGSVDKKRSQEQDLWKHKIIFSHRCQFRWLQYSSTASSQCRSNLPSSHQKGVVPSTQKIKICIQIKCQELNSENNHLADSRRFVEEYWSCSITHWVSWCLQARMLMP